MTTETEIGEILNRIGLAWRVAYGRYPQVNEINVGSWETYGPDGRRSFEGFTEGKYHYRGDMVPIRIDRNLEPGEFRLDLTFLKR